MAELTQAQIDGLRAAPPEQVFGWFISMFPPEFARQLDFMLLQHPPEYVFTLPSAATIPAAVKEVTIKALNWRKRQLILSAGLN